MFASPHTLSTGLPLIDAESDFRHARRAYAVGRIRDWMRRSGCSRSPRTVPTQGMMLGAGPPRLEAVPLGAIVGTLEPSASFDASFRPASNEMRRRWERIALAHRKGDVLPPIVLRHQPDGYYVIDGRHRVSVARALKHQDIDAWVTGPA